jgi:hypothetical protein
MRVVSLVNCFHERRVWLHGATLVGISALNVHLGPEPEHERHALGVAALHEPAKCDINLSLQRRETFSVRNGLL